MKALITGFIVVTDWPAISQRIYIDENKSLNHVYDDKVKWKLSDGVDNLIVISATMYCRLFLVQLKKWSYGKN